MTVFKSNDFTHILSAIASGIEVTKFSLLFPRSELVRTLSITAGVLGGTVYLALNRFLWFFSSRGFVEKNLNQPPFKPRLGGRNERLVKPAKWFPFFKTKPVQQKDWFLLVFYDCRQACSLSWVRFTTKGEIKGLACDEIRCLIRLKVQLGDTL